MPQWSTTKIGKDFSTSNYYSGNVTEFACRHSRFRLCQAYDCCGPLFCEYKTDICRTLTEVYRFH